MNYHNITKDDFLNGEGLRVVLWIAGCLHHCKNCHNKITWDPNSGLLFDDSAKAEIYEQLSKDYISGLTLSGGDPLHPNNIADILSLLRDVKSDYPNKNVWLYTGSKWEEICMLPHMRYIDVVVDGEFIESLQDNGLMWKGSSNQQVIDVQATLLSGNKKVPILKCGDYYDDSDEYHIDDTIELSAQDMCMCEFCV